jgi:hypothetical protein
MEKIFFVVVDGIAHGGPTAIIMILLGVVALLIWDRMSLVKNIKENSTIYREDINKVVEKYQEGQLNVIQALNEIRYILIKIEAKS